MAALLDNSQAPLLIQAPDGSLIPVSGGALRGADGPQIAAAMSPAVNGMTAAPMPRAAGQGGALIAASQAPTGAQLTPRKIGQSSSGALLPGPRQPEVIGGDDNSMDGLGAIAKAIGTAAGKSGAVANTGAGDPGILDKLKGWLGIGSANKTADPNADVTGATAPLPPPVQTGALPPIPTNDQPPVPQSVGALGPDPSAPKPVVTAQDGSQTTVASPTADDLSATMAQQSGMVPPTSAAAADDSDPDFLRRIATMMGRKPQLNDNPETAALMKERYGDDYKAPDYWDRLRENGTAMALLTGGLATMAAAGKPGASVGGALGQGGLTGLQTVYQQREAQREADLAARKEASEEGLRQAQGQFYGDRGDVLHQNADTNAGYRGALANAALTKADAATDTAAARKTAADAAMVKAKNAASGTNNPTAMMKNAQFYVDNGIAPDLETAVGMLKTAATNPGQRSSLITARARMKLGSKVMPTDQDVEQAKIAATREVDQELAAAAPARAARSGGALPAPGGTNPPNRAPKAGGGLDKNTAINQARNALKQGADRGAVIKRLQGMGIDPSEL